MNRKVHRKKRSSAEKEKNSVGNEQTGPGQTIEKKEGAQILE